MGEKEDLKKQIKELKEQKEIAKLKEQVKELQGKGSKAKKVGKKVGDFFRPKGNESDAMNVLMGY